MLCEDDLVVVDACGGGPDVGVTLPVRVLVVEDNCPVGVLVEVGGCPVGLAVVPAGVVDVPTGGAPLVVSSSSVVPVEVGRSISDVVVGPMITIGGA